jgi:predicted RNase H-like nuclease
MTLDEREILVDIQRKLDTVVDDIRTKVDKLDAIVCGDRGLVDQVEKNTLTLYGDANVTGLVEKARLNRVISVGAMGGVLIYVITHIQDVVLAIGKKLGFL